MNFRIANTIFKKEMLDTMRDKRTLIMMIGVPMLLYPLLLIVGLQGLLIQSASLDKKISRVALQTSEPDTVRTWLADVEKIELVEVPDPAAALEQGDLDAIVFIDGPVAALLGEGKSVDVELRFDSTEFESMDAAGRLRDGLDKDAKSMLDIRLKSMGVEADYIEPLKIERKDMSPPAKTTGNALGTVLPILMVVMLAVGAFYPAVDVTAGEKERGTFETLLSTPASKLEIVAGKFLTVFLLAMAAGLLNLASMAATFAFMASQVQQNVDTVIPFELKFPPSAILVIFLIMIPLAFFISALMMAIAVFARSFKEAQNYVTPFLIVITMPALFAAMPGVKLNAMTQFIPVANAILLFRDMMTGKAGLLEAFPVFLSTAAFAALSLLFAAWLFQREEVILSEEKGFPLTWRRSEFRPRQTLTASMAMGLFTVLLIVLFTLGSTVQSWQLLPGLLITEWLLLLAPILFLLGYGKVNIRTALNLRRLPWWGFLGSLSIGFFSIVLVIQLSYLFNKVLPMPKEIQEAMGQLFSSDGSISQLLFLLFVAAVSPAICEEVLFRGAILSGLRQRMGVWPAIILAGVLFGLFHLDVFRIPPIAVLGMVLTYLTVRTGSIYAAMLVHLMNNSFAILLTTDRLPAGVGQILQLEYFEANGLPRPVLLVASLGFVASVVFFEYAARRFKPVEA